MGVNTPTMDTAGIELIREERWRQVYEKGCCAKRDEHYRKDELALAAACYVLPHDLRVAAVAANTQAVPALWPWSPDSWRPGFTPPLGERDQRARPPRREPELVARIRELTKAGALIAAELDRLQAKRRDVEACRLEDEEAQRRKDADGTDGNP